MGWVGKVKWARRVRKKRPLPQSGQLVFDDEYLPGGHPAASPRLMSTINFTRLLCGRCVLSIYILGLKSSQVMTRPWLLHLSHISGLC